MGHRLVGLLRSECRLARFSLVKRQPAAKPFIACALPVALIVVSMMLGGMMEF
jgi:hypothetical protein